MNGTHYILWIDDDLSGVALAASVLRSEGVEVDQACCAADGIASVSDRPYDLILLDAQLPDAHGIDVLRAFRTLGLATPTILVTGFATVPMTVEAMRLGASDVLSKPFFADDALSLLARYVTFRSNLEGTGPTGACTGGDSARSAQFRALTQLTVAQPGLSLKATSRALSIDRHAVERLVRKQTGLTWRDWRRQLLMKRAAVVIASSDVPLKVLPQRFGYSSIQAFSRAFHDVCGVSPGRYRDQRDVGLRRRGVTLPSLTDSDPPNHS